MTNQSNHGAACKTMQSPTKIMHFKRGGTLREIIICYLGIYLIMGLFAVMDFEKWHRLYPTPAHNIIGGLVVGSFLAGLWVWFGVQQVQIDAANETIRFTNAGTCHCWRAFNVQEVISMRLLDEHGQGVLGLIILLAPATGRRWTHAHILNTRSGFDRDSAIFLALVQQIRTVHPDMKVANLPDSYKGGLSND